MELFLFLLLWLVFSAAVCVYADNKGRSGIGFFFLSLLLSPLVAFLIAAVMKPDPAALAAGGKLKKCPDCAEYVQPEARKCRFCGHEFSAALSDAARPAMGMQAEEGSAAGWWVLVAVVVVLAGLAVYFSLPSGSPSVRPPGLEPNPPRAPAAPGPAASTRAAKLPAVPHRAAPAPLLQVTLLALRPCVIMSIIDGQQAEQKLGVLDFFRFQVEQSARLENLGPVEATITLIGREGTSRYRWAVGPASSVSIGRDGALSYSHPGAISTL